MKLLSTVLLSACLLAPALVTAQAEIDAPQMVSYESDEFTLQYPDSWEVDTVAESTDGLVFHIPIAGEGSVGDGIVLQREDLRAMVGVQAGGKESAYDFALNLVAGLASGEGGFKAGMALAFRVGERDAAFADVLGLLPLRFVVMTLDNESKLVIMLAGIPAQFAESMPMLLDVMNTVRLPDDDTPAEATVIEYLLPETHIRKNDWSFNYPAGWIAEDQQSYTLLTVPGIDTTIGISTNYDNAASDLAGWSNAVLDSLLSRVPEGEHETITLEVNGSPALRLDFRIPEEDFGFTELFVNPGDNILVSMTAIGAPLDITMLDPVMEQIAATVEIAS